MRMNDYGYLQMNLGTSPSKNISRTGPAVVLKDIQRDILMSQVSPIILISRMGNLMKNAITSTSTKNRNKLMPFPKLIVVVPDDDMIKCSGEVPVDGISSTNLGRLVKFVMTEHERNIASFKENLTIKSRRDNYPHIVWILAPMHDNFSNNAERYKFNRAVEDMCQFHSNVSCLELKKVWNPKDDGLFCKEFNRYTATGLKSYWEAVDRTIRYCDTVVLKKREKIPKRGFQSTGISGNTSNRRPLNTTSNCQNDRFKWMNPSISRDVKKFKQQRRLPTPPRRN